MAGDETCRLQPGEVHVNQGPADAEVSGELADAGALPRQGRKDPQPVRVGQCGQRLQQLISALESVLACPPIDTPRLPVRKYGHITEMHDKGHCVRALRTLAGALFGRARAGAGMRMNCE